MMHTATAWRRAALTAFLLWLACAGSSCAHSSIYGEAALARLAFSGKASYTLGPGSGGSLNPANEIDSDFGLDDPDNLPYLRLGGSLGGIGLAGSAYRFETEGKGSLSSLFGSIGVGQQVESRIRLRNLRGAVYPLDLGPTPWLSVEPGLGLDLFDLEIQASPLTGLVEEQIDAYAPIPILCLRLSLSLACFETVLEGGYMHLPRQYIEDFKGDFFDLEGLLRYRPGACLVLFAGYRHTRFDGQGEANGDEYTMDFAVDGWFLGAGVDF